MPAEKFEILCCRMSFNSFALTVKGDRLFGVWEQPDERKIAFQIAHDQATRLINYLKGTEISHETKLLAGRKDEQSEEQVSYIRTREDNFYLRLDRYGLAGGIETIEVAPAAQEGLLSFLITVSSRASLWGQKRPLPVFGL